MMGCHKAPAHCVEHPPFSATSHLISNALMLRERRSLSHSTNWPPSGPWGAGQRQWGAAVWWAVCFPCIPANLIMSNNDKEGRGFPQCSAVLGFREQLVGGTKNTAVP